MSVVLCKQSGYLRAHIEQLIDMWRTAYFAVHLHGSVYVITHGEFGTA